jgi:hypothetical protein
MHQGSCLSREGPFFCNSAGIPPLRFRSDKTSDLRRKIRVAVVYGPNSWESALNEAQKEKRPVLLKLYLEGCPHCLRLDRETHADQAGPAAPGGIEPGKFPALRGPHLPNQAHSELPSGRFFYSIWGRSWAGHQRGRLIQTNKRFHEATGYLRHGGLPAPGGVANGPGSHG